MSKHTPGPWRHLVEKDDPTVVYIETSEDNIAAVVRPSADLSLADAHLIAAAPDLLKEYEQLLAAIKDASWACLKGNSDVAEDLCHEYADFKSPAIAKAKGEIV